MIFEGSCDTEDWSNDAENSALSWRDKKKIHSCVYTVYMYMYEIYCIFEQISAALVSIRVFFFSFSLF